MSHTEALSAMSSVYGSCADRIEARLTLSCNGTMNPPR